MIEDPFDNLNEGYAEDGLRYNTEDGYDYRTKQGYSDWKSDKLWLPSLSETGHGHWTDYKTDEHGTLYFPEGEKYDAGLWNTTWNQTTTDSHAYSTWLRSGDSQTALHQNGDLAFSLDIAGSMGATNVDSFSRQEHYVRPAIHLNLTAIEDGSHQNETVGKPQSQTVTAEYDGQSHTMAISDYAEMNFGDIPDGAEFSYGILSAVNAGTYTLQATPKSGKWNDGTADPIEFTLNITPLPIDVHIYGDKEGGFHIFGQTPTVDNLRLSALYNTFVGDDGIQDLGEINPVLTSRKDGKVYPFDENMPVGTYDVEIQNGVYNNYKVTFSKSAAFDRIEECVYTVLPADDIAILVSGYLVQDGFVTVPYDGKQKFVGLLNIDDYEYQLSPSYYQDGEKLVNPPAAPGEYTVNISGTYPATFTLIIDDDNLPPEKPTSDKLTLTKTYTGNKITLTISHADKLTFGAVPEGATLEGGAFSAVNAGVYELTASPKDGQWRDGTRSGSVTFVLTVQRADIDVTHIEYRVDGVAPDADGFTVAFNGSTKTLTVIGLPANARAEITYFQNDTQLDAPPVATGEYTVKITFSVTDPANYNIPAERQFVLTVTKGSLDFTNVQYTVGGKSPAGQVFDVVYDGSAKILLVAGLPQGVEFTVTYFSEGTELDGAPTNAGVYTVKVEFSLAQGSDYDLPAEQTFTVVIAKADADISRVTYKVSGTATSGNAFEVVCDGKAKSLDVGNLPQGVTATVEYFSGNTKLEGAPTDVGEYTVKVIFAVTDPANYNVPQVKEFVLAILENSSIGPDDPVKPDTPVDPTTPDTPSDPTEQNVQPWWWIVISVVAVAVAVAVTIVFVKRKKK